MQVMFESGRERLPRRVALTIQAGETEIYRQQGILCNMEQQAFPLPRTQTYRATPSEVAGGYLPIIHKYLGTLRENILIGETFYIHEEYRRCGLLRSMNMSYRQHFAAGNVQFGCYFIYPHWLERDKDGEFVGAGNPSKTKKLRRLYRMLGFVDLPGTEFMYLLTERRPERGERPRNPILADEHPEIL